MIQQEAEYVLKLLRSVLEETKPIEKPDFLDWQKVFQYAKKQGVENMVFYAIEKLENQPEKMLKKQWSDARNQEMMRSIVQLEERDRLLQRFSDVRIRVLPLKGALLKEMYPQLDYRRMADLDFLIENGKEKLVKRLMEEDGYSVENFDNGNHDIYHKKPYCNIEIHRCLFDKTSVYHQYFKNILERTQPFPGTDFIRKMSWENYYIYMVSHMSKHFCSAGTGIRSIMDIFVFLRKNKENLDWEYIETELEKIQLNDFRKQLEKIAENWFGRGSFSVDEKMEESLTENGLYGTYENYIENTIRKFEGKNGKIQIGKYLQKRIFTDLEILQSGYPILKNNPALLPAVWVYRVLRAIILKRKNVCNEMKLIIHLSRENNQI